MMATYPHRLRMVAGLFAYLATLCVAFALVSTDANRVARAVSAMIALAVAAGFCLAYHRRTRGHWRDTVHGVHLMTFSVAISAMLAYIVLALFGWLPLWLMPYVSAWIYLTLAFLFLWRWSLLRDSQRRPVEPKDS